MRKGYFLIAVLLSFLAGAVMSSRQGWGSPIVTVDVVNKTDKKLTEVALQYQSCGNKSHQVAKSIAAGERKRFTFLVCGEGGYEVTVRGEGSDSILKSGGYVESGYYAQQVVTADAIQSQSKAYKP